MKTMLKKFYELQLLMVEKGMKSDVLVYPGKFASMTTYTLSGKLDQMLFSDSEDGAEKVEALINTFKTGE